MMRFYLSHDCALKSLERPCVYSTESDELYELDNEAFGFLCKCSSPEGCEAPESGFTVYCLAEGILTGTRVEARRPPVEKSPSPSLRYLELQITRRCNLRCRHCYLGPPDTLDLPVGRLRRVLEEFEAMQGLRVLITGGEPLMHRQFRRINAMLPDFALRKELFTNGMLLTKETLRGLNVDEIQMSIDGLREAHEALRGRGAYRRAMECMRNALEAGFPVSVSTMVHAGNLGDFEKMERIFTGMGIRNWTVDVPCVQGNLKDNPGLQLSPEEAGGYLGYGFGKGPHNSGEGFACGLHLVSVMADGGCAKCAFYSETPVGRISEGLAACWKRIRHIRLHDLLCDCEHMEVCRGGCRYRAELMGSPLGKDLYKCSLYDRI